MKTSLYSILSKGITLIILLSKLFWIALILSYFMPLARLIHLDLIHNAIYSSLVYVRNVLMSPVHELISQIYTQPISPLAYAIINIILLWIFMAIIDSILSRFLWTLKRRHFYAAQRKQLEQIKDQNQNTTTSNIAFDNRLSDSDKITTDHNLYLALESKLEQLNQAKTKSETEEYYNEFMHMKKKLGSMARHFAFLSLDVVDSTGMKESEDKSLIQLDFMRFKKMVQQIVDDFGAVQSTWTPDGAMISFNTMDNAVEATKEIFKELARFNEQVKKINRDFLIRCGINAGIIYFDDKLKLDEITDLVIDIAGHLQKHADPGTIAITQSSIITLGDSSGFNKTNKVVDGFEVAEWRMEPLESPEPESEKQE